MNGTLQIWIWSVSKGRDGKNQLLDLRLKEPVKWRNVVYTCDATAVIK